MCGFSGIYNYSEPVDHNILKAMTDCIKHRGPDDEGYLLFDTCSGSHKHYCGDDSSASSKSRLPILDSQFEANLGMGFRRLSILDLSDTGHQPMSIADVDLHIVFNGEIYNYLELRNELNSYGCSFRGSSDTEVILNAYKVWGKECVVRFIGMWAFAIWDGINKELFCSRDPFGIKPFYYTTDKSGIYFGSELKQLRFSPVSDELNCAMIWRSMKINAMLVYSDETFWKNYRSLLPGHNLLVRNGTVSQTPYYQLELSKFERSPMKYSDAVDKYKALFQDSMRLQMRSDVEIGSCLSGGLDSSAIVCSAMQYSDYNLQTFSSYYAEDSTLDERKWIKIVADYTKVKSHLVSPLAKDTINWFEQATYYNDLPVGAGYVSQYAVMKLAKENGVKVLLDGQGSDEMNAGYFHANYRYLADLLRSLKFVKFATDYKAIFSSSQKARPLPTLAKSLLCAILPESKLYELEFAHYRFEPFNEEFRCCARAQVQNGVLSEIHDIPGSRLSNFLYNMMRVTSIQTLLHYEDRMSMAHSIESRVPFLDTRLIEFVFSLPSEYKIKPPIGKLIHREAMMDIVPKAISQRRDKGIFSSPFYSIWLRRDLNKYVESIFNSPEFRNRKIWNLSLIKSKWRDFQAGNTKHAEMVFNVIALENWFRCHVDKSTYPV